MAAEDGRENALYSKQARLKILVADHDPAVGEVLSALVANGGNEAIAVRDGDEAEARIRQQRPDMIIADWWLPAKGGLELVRTVRSSDDGYRPYIILMTDGQEDEGLEAAFRAGADDFLPKPLRQQAVLARLRTGLRLVRLLDDSRRQGAELSWYAEELTRTQERFQQSVLTDDLTGLPNRRCAEERMQREWVEAGARGASLACLIIDVDNFRKFNECFGRERGDALLKTLAGALKEAVRQADLVCRMGGDRFLVICPGCDLAEALAQGETLLDKLSETLARESGAVPLGLSIGAAQRGKDTDDFRCLIRLADRGMHRAKFNGRNRVVSGHGGVG